MNGKNEVLSATVSAVIWGISFSSFTQRLPGKTGKKKKKIKKKHFFFFIFR